MSGYNSGKYVNASSMSYFAMLCYAYTMLSQCTVQYSTDSTIMQVSCKGSYVYDTKYRLFWTECFCSGNKKMSHWISKLTSENGKLRFSSETLLQGDCLETGLVEFILWAATYMVCHLHTFFQMPNTIVIFILKMCDQYI